MKFSLPLVLALFGTALAAPIEAEEKRSEQQNPDILYNNQAGWGKRSEKQNPDILYNNQAGWGKRSEKQNPDILYNNQAGWGK
ncbi:hypothetical protein VHEMI04285 [[Torrubiella] hemipterigena]|uniref:Uncharacterized protein n=1 Tax=[Torrubiella] hemipterigena TaxID=1531966 RepID=A0A0A1TDU4_9HYPO|nr:hypothetical protein VHEMI04285 [[Torrubiella] hemipterigena]